jgi:hypothetical protein
MNSEIDELRAALCVLGSFAAGFGVCFNSYVWYNSSRYVIVII